MYAQYALLRLHMLPSTYMGLERQEKAFVIASIDLKIQAEKEAMDKAKRQAKKGR